MKKLSFIAAAVLLSTLRSSAQHCPWDGTSFIMLDLKTAKNIQIKQINLVDSAGTKVTSNWYTGSPDNPRVDTAVFWKNSDVDPNDRSRQGRIQHFSFAKDYYILSFGQYNYEMPYQLMINYTDANGKSNRSLIALPKGNVHPLCTLNKELWGGKNKPVEISL